MQQRDFFLQRADDLVEVAIAVLKTLSFGELSTKIHSAAKLLAVVDVAHNALIEGQRVTLRSLFYRHVPIFGNQRASNEVVGNLTNVLKVTRRALNIVSRPKGMVFGDLQLGIRTNSGEVVFIKADNELEQCGHKILSYVDDYISFETRCQRVLLIEKETVFHRLISAGTIKAADAIALTACGMPDTPTLEFASCLIASMRRNGPIEAYVLVDSDPEGFSIAASFLLRPEQYLLKYRFQEKTIGGIQYHDFKSIDDLLQIMTFSDSTPTHKGIKFTNRQLNKLQRLFDIWQNEICCMPHWTSWLQNMLKKGSHSPVDNVLDLEKLVHKFMVGEPTES